MGASEPRSFTSLFAPLRAGDLPMSTAIMARSVFIIPLKFHSENEMLTVIFVNKCYKAFV